MKRTIPIVMAAFVISGCATAVDSPPMNATEARLQNDYYRCMTRAHNDASQCAREKDRLLQEQEWDILQITS